MLAYGQTLSGELAHVSTVDRGLACGCICPACLVPLEAKRGSVRAAHFAHASGENCAYSVETALHKLAKEWLSTQATVLLPELIARGQRTATTVVPQSDFAYESVALEHRLGDTVPDIVLWSAHATVLVEIAVTHECDAVKLGKLATLGLPAVEIDLSSYSHALPNSEVKEAVLRTARRKWLFHPLLAPAQTRIRQEENAAEKRRREIAARQWERDIARRRDDARRADERRRNLLRQTVSHETPKFSLAEAESRDGREQILERAALRVLRTRADDWLLRPCPSLDGYTPRNFARASIRNLRVALSVLPK